MLTKDKIINEALHLFFEKGYKGTSLRDIAEAVGIKKPSLYAHFESREALGRAVLETLLHHELDESLFRLEPRAFLEAFLLHGAGPREEILTRLHTGESLITELLHYFPEYRQRSHSFQVELHERIVEYFTLQIEEGKIRKGCNPEVIAWQIIALPHGLVLNQMGGLPFDTAPILKDIAEEMWDNIKPQQSAG